MKRYKITMKLLSPVHIGTGEDFEPMNYVMDTGTIITKEGKSIEGKFLYIFDDPKIKILLFYGREFIIEHVSLWQISNGYK